MIKFSSMHNEATIKNNLNEEINYINAFIKFQKELKDSISQNFDLISLHKENIKFMGQNEQTELFQKSFESRVNLDCNIINLQNLNKQLKIIKNTTNPNYKKEIKAYNTLFKSGFAQINSNTKHAKKVARKLYNSIKKLDLNEDEAKLSTIPVFDLTPIEDNKTLTISESQKKVFLPYLVSDLRTKISDTPNKYSSLQDLINKEYIIPTSYYKNASFARFKEAYKLIREKEKGSISDAFNLSFEVIFNYNLNPAIISACKNLDELDIYLDCLEDDEIEQFYCFNIVYEVPPTTVK